MTPGVSVIICCYNSSKRLSETLTHLMNQQYRGFGFEIIVVDNASTDDTSEVARKILSPGTAEFQIVQEPQSGLSYARRKGYSTARFEYLLYCDDDNWLAPNYIQLVFESMTNNLKIGILGGLGEAVFEITEPVWFKKYEIDFAVGEQSTANESLSRVEEVYGAGFTIRKAYLDKLFASGFKSILSDRKGNQLISGGDVELCYLVKYFGYEVWYNRDLKFKHLMTAPRLNWLYMKRLYEGNGRTNVYTFAYKYFEKHNNIPGENLRLPFWLDTFIHKVKYTVNYFPKVMWKMNKAGDEEVLRFIAMKAEAREIWTLKEKYSELYRTIYLYINKPASNQ